MARNRYENSEWEKRHQRNVSRYERLIDEIFRSAAAEAASIVGVAGKVDSEKPFSFGDYPATKRRVDRLLADVQSGVEAVVVNGIEAEWQLANEKNDELCDRVFGDGAGSLSEAQRRQYYTTNSGALEQFRARKISGLSLSDRVWRYTEQFKDEIEMGIDIGIRDGMSADRLSRQLRQYLQYPDKLFRRVRDEHGNLVLSRRARAFHPGQGVYRSSYKNARRLAATETNIAYRSADYERWKRLDFVVGIHVILSNNHTTRDSKGKKVPLYDICNELSGKDENDKKGKYPKDFKFTGWHPQCRCHAISILKTQEEMDADNRRIMEGGEPTGSEDSANAVRDVPAAFRKWVEENAERIEGAKSLPYFISDNRGVVDGILQGRSSIGSVKGAGNGANASGNASLPQGQGSQASSLNDVIDECKKQNIQYLEVKDLVNPLTEEEIIAKVSGKGIEAGACASLSFAYAANKSGMDVCDFRGGVSRKFFSAGGADKALERAGAKIERDTNDFNAVIRILRGTQQGKEYILSTGGHMSVVRRTGKSFDFEYLELQSYENSGWKTLTRAELDRRFGCQKSHSLAYIGKIKVPTYLLDVMELANDSAFRELMGYINTAADKQGKWIPNKK